MVVAAALPLLMKPDATRYANIGFGSGLTAEMLLSHSGPREVDTIEIEPAMVSGARSFIPRVIRPYRDRRSNIVIEDAKSFFARHGKRYDVIISEPSNPWVNGVANLFTTEWYRDVKRYLAPGGLLVQWLQTYEFNDRLLGSILMALNENFSDYEIYETNAVDLILVAVAEGSVPRPGPLPVKEAAFMDQLKRLGITRAEEIAAMSVGTKSVIAPLFSPLASPVNSDYRPIVQLEAPLARFRGSYSTAVSALVTSPLPIREMANRAAVTYLREPLPAYVPSLNLRTQSAALEIARGLLQRTAEPLDTGDRVVNTLLALKRPGALCGAAVSKTAIEQLHRAAELTLAKLAPDLRRALWIEPRWLGCAPGKLSPRVRQRLEIYAAIAARDAPAMLARARALLEQGGTTDGGDEWGRFLLLTAMLGAQVAGEHAEAQRVWRAYGAALYPGGVIPPHVIFVNNLS
jgi:trans-aconitate methyltransferase